MHPNETTAAELPDSTLVFSSRDQNGGDEWHRLRATSSDGGATFDAPLMSSPSNPDQRVDLRIRTSSDAGLSRDDGLLVAAGPAAYSDLIALPGSTVGVLFETGTVAANERIDFASVGFDRIRSIPR